MELKDMGKSKDRRIEETERMMKPDLAEEYPSGLRLHLGADQISALGLEGMDDIGEEMMIHAKGCIVELSNEDGEGLRMEIQLKSMAVDTEDDDEPAEGMDGTTKGKVKSLMSYYGKNNG